MYHIIGSHEIDNGMECYPEKGYSALSTSLNIDELKMKDPRVINICDVYKNIILKKYPDLFIKELSSYVTKNFGKRLTLNKEDVIIFIERSKVSSHFEGISVTITVKDNLYDLGELNKYFEIEYIIPFLYNKTIIDLEINHMTDKHIRLSCSNGEKYILSICSNRNEETWISKVKVSTLDIGFDLHPFPSWGVIRKQNHHSILYTNNIYDPFINRCFILKLKNDKNIEIFYSTSIDNTIGSFVFPYTIEDEEYIRYELKDSTSNEWESITKMEDFEWINRRPRIMSSKNL